MQGGSKNFPAADNELQSWLTSYQHVLQAQSEDGQLGQLGQQQPTPPEVAKLAEELKQSEEERMHSSRTLKELRKLAVGPFLFSLPKLACKLACKQRLLQPHVWH